MPPRLLTRFWQALEQVPDQATERLEWRQRLSEEWPLAGRWLRPTGRVVERVACPNPSGDGCPRIVVRHPDGRIVGVCGDRPQRCDPVGLNADDLEVVTLNRTALSDDLRELLKLSSPSGVASNGEVLVIGILPLLAGIGLAVFMVFPSDGRRIEVRDLPILPLQLIGGLLLTPTGERVETLPEPWFAIALADLISTDLASIPTLTPAGERHLELIKDKTRSAFEKSDTAAWRLPMDATWGELLIEFTADEVVNAQFRGRTRHFEPAQLAMLDRRTSRANRQWLLLKTFATRRGTIKPQHTSEHSKFLKHKQELCATLQRQFGLEDDPIPHDRRSDTHRTKFVIRSVIPSPPRDFDADENENSF